MGFIAREKVVIGPPTLNKTDQNITYYKALGGVKESMAIQRKKLWKEMGGKETARLGRGRKDETVLEM